MGKRIISVLLLIFVAASVTYLIAKEVRSRNGAAASGTAAEPPALDKVAQNDGSTQRAPAPQARRVVAYYFYGNVRCDSCRKIEAWSRQIVQRDFAGAIQQGHLQWKAININEPGNEHFVKDYQLATRSVVLAAFDGDKQTHWKNLEEVWGRLGNQDDFTQYIQRELAEFLKE